jgi:hypothetical protein
LGAIGGSSCVVCEVFLFFYLFFICELMRCSCVVDSLA